MDIPTTWLVTAQEVPQGTEEVYLRARVGQSKRLARVVSGRQDYVFSVPVNVDAVADAVRACRLRWPRERLYVEMMAKGAQGPYSETWMVEDAQVEGLLVEAGDGPDRSMEALQRMTGLVERLVFRTIQTNEALMESNAGLHAALVQAQRRQPQVELVEPDDEKARDPDRFKRLGDLLGSALTAAQRQAVPVGPMTADQVRKVWAGLDEAGREAVMQVVGEEAERLGGQAVPSQAAATVEPGPAGPPQG